MSSDRSDTEEHAEPLRKKFCLKEDVGISHNSQLTTAEAVSPDTEGVSHSQPTTAEAVCPDTEGVSHIQTTAIETVSTDTKTKLQEGSSGAAAAVLASHISKMEMVRVLCDFNPQDNSVSLEAKHSELEGRIIMRLQLQNLSFSADAIQNLISGCTQVKQLSQNDVFSTYTATLPAPFNQIHVEVIHPAMGTHFFRADLSNKQLTVVDETPEMYRTCLKPQMKDKRKKSQWIYNILDGRSEADRVVYRDEDPATGFVLVPDSSWTGKQVTDLHCLALVMRRDLCSIRDLTANCLPLLQNIKERGTAAIVYRYSVRPDSLMVYLHYRPAFYHLHVHFTAVSNEPSGQWFGKAHALTDVISILECNSDYYPNATLCTMKSKNSQYTPSGLKKRSRKRKRSSSALERTNLVQPIQDRITRLANRLSSN